MNHHPKTLRGSDTLKAVVRTLRAYYEGLTIRELVRIVCVNDPKTAICDIRNLIREGKVSGFDIISEPWETARGARAVRYKLIEREPGAVARELGEDVAP